MPDNATDKVSAHRQSLANTDLAARLLQRLLADPLAPSHCPDLYIWWPRHQQIANECGSPIELSITAGLQADRAGWAFASGYQAALHALLPQLPHDRMAAMCVSEAGGNSPKAIESTLGAHPEGGLRLNGQKRWTTLGPASSSLLVAARDERAQTGALRPAIVLVRVDAGLPGVQLEPMPQLAFVPEVAHGQVRFENVRLEADSLLTGDGYDSYVKPFRCHEDVQVSAALLAYLFNQARLRDWPHDWCERACATLLAFGSLSSLDAAAPATHIALGGVLHWTAALYDEAGKLFAAGPQDDIAQRWARDSALLQLAKAVRLQRVAKAWERL